MSDLPAQGLFQQLHARPVSGEHLEVLGKKASADWQAGRYKTLTEAVTETVKHASLAPEQVRRVTEFANTDAFLTEFKKEGNSHKVVDFPDGPADPSEILKDLNDGGGGSVFDRGTLDYDQPPTEKMAEKTAAAENDISQFFGELTEEKPYQEENPLGDVVDLRDKLSSAEGHLTAEISGLETLYGDLAERVYYQVKQASLAGVPLGHVVQAWSTVAPSSEYVKVAFQMLAPRLVEEHIFEGDALEQSLSKTAGARAVNLKHPLVTDFGDYCQVLSKLAELRAAREEVCSGLGQLNTFLKQAAGGVWGALTEGAEQLSHPIGGLAKGIGEIALGKGNEHAQALSDLTRKAVKYSPHIAAGLGAHELYRMVKYNPTAQGAKDTIMSMIPLTPQYQNREYNLQSGYYV